jgi:hypothetical protein
MYAYSPFSSDNDIGTGNILILLFSRINDNFNFSWELILIYYYYVDCFVLYLFVSYLVSVFLLVPTVMFART